MYTHTYWNSSWSQLRWLQPAGPVIRMGDDTVGKPHRPQIYQFELFELILLSRLDKQSSSDSREQYLSQQCPPPLWYEDLGTPHTDVKSGCCRSAGVSTVWFERVLWHRFRVLEFRFRAWGFKGYVNVKGLMFSGLLNVAQTCLGDACSVLSPKSHRPELLDLRDL